MVYSESQMVYTFKAYKYRMNTIWFLVHKYNNIMRRGGQSCYCTPYYSRGLQNIEMSISGIYPVTWIPKDILRKGGSDILSQYHRRGQFWIVWYMKSPLSNAHYTYLSQFKVRNWQLLKNLLISSEDLPVVSGKKKRETIEKNKEVRP